MILAVPSAMPYRKPIGVRAFGGGPLLGTKLVRVIYLDETGHSVKEPVAIVAGLLLDPDKQWRNLADELEALKEKVPKQFREGFYFHAADLEQGGKYRREWADEERWALLNAVLALPRQLKIPLVVGFFQKRFDRGGDAFAESKVVHAIAYGLCLRSADWFMENLAAKGEVAMVVAEQRDEARKAIEAIHRLLVDQPLLEKVLEDEALRKGFPIKRIKGPPAFATKEDEPLLQIADACAFAFQRHIKNAPRSDDRLEALFGDFAHPAGLGQMRFDSNSVCFGWEGRESFHSAF